MYAPINILEIIRDYYTHMRKDFAIIPLILVLIIFPFTLGFVFLLIAKDSIYDDLTTISAILIPLLLNLLMIVYYSLERTSNEDEIKIEYLEHLNSTISMTTLTAFFVLLLSLIVSNLGKIPVLNELMFSVMGFLIVNVLICLVRIYRLIRHEIVNKVNKVGKE